MMGRRFVRGLMVAAALGMTMALATTAQAQFIPPNGVMVDAEGVLHRQEFQDPTGELTRARANAARAALSKDVQKPSKLRMVSLTRLEAAIEAGFAQQKSPTDEMLHLAGLSRVKYVFFFPETKDIVLAGPAEGWMVDLAGRTMGLESKRPVLELNDLVAALRAYPPQGKKTSVIMCSIDPTKEGLARMQAYMASQAGNFNGDSETIVDGLRTAMGMQDIRVGGVSAKTHFAQVLIEADYRMKLIGIGLEKPAVKMINYVDRADLGQISSNGSQRWFFQPNYQCVRVSDDELGMELVGDGVELVGEDQLIGRDGARNTAPRSNKASQAFVTAFTKKYSEIAARTPIFSQLRDCIDLAVAAAYMQKHDFYGKAGWKMKTFSDEKAMPIEILNTPVHVETSVTAVFKGGRVGFPISGGVHIEPLQALNSSNLLDDDHDTVGKAREQVDLKALVDGQWWWDAAK